MAKHTYKSCCVHTATFLEYISPLFNIWMKGLYWTKDSIAEFKAEKFNSCIDKVEFLYKLQHADIAPFHKKTKATRSVIRQKRANLKTGVSRKQSTSNFPKSEDFLPPDTYTYTCVLGGKKCSFRKIWRTLFSWITRFEILPFALLLTNKPITDQ